MQSHPDDEHTKGQLDRTLAEISADREQAFEMLKREAAASEAEGHAKITAGEPGEKPLFEWEKYGVTVKQYAERPTDEALNITRLSLGGSPTEGFTYLVFRGSNRDAKDILRRATNALRDGP